MKLFHLKNILFLVFTALLNFRQFLDILNFMKKYLLRRELIHNQRPNNELKLFIESSLLDEKLSAKRSLRSHSNILIQSTVALWLCFPPMNI